MKRFVGFIGASYTSQSVNTDAERCVNLFPELTPPGFGKDREVMSLRSTPGSSLFGTVGSGPIRGSFVADGRAFVVSGVTLYELSSLGAGTSRGTLNTFTGTVGMEYNGVSLVIIDGTYGYALTLADNTFAQITDGDFPIPSSVGFVDQYIIITTDNGQFNISALLDATDWDALDFATAEGSPDDLVGLIVDHRDVFLLGEDSTEVWFNTGDPDFPFSRKTFMEIGCGNIDTAKKFDNSVVFGGVTKAGIAGVVRVNDGSNYVIISTPAMDKLIADNGGFSGCTSWTYKKDKHEFYCLNLPTANTTICYDASTQLWHERSYTPVDGTGETRHRADNHIYCFGKHLVGDYQNGNVYELSDTVYSDNSAPITRRRRAPHLAKSGARLFHRAFELDMETGVGLTSGQGVDPEVILRWSNDAGHTWHEATGKSFGAQGQYKTRVKWERLGMARTRTYEVVVTDPVRVTLLGANLDVAEGRS